MAASKPSTPIAKKAKSKKSAKSKSAKSGLVMPVARINRSMKMQSNMKRVGGSAPVYMTAVMEFIAAEILELSGNETKSDKKRKQITLEDVLSAVRKDKELDQWLSNFAVCSAEKVHSKRPGS
jgi:histone H2A